MSDLSIASSFREARLAYQLEWTIFPFTNLSIINSWDDETIEAWFTGLPVQEDKVCAP